METWRRLPTHVGASDLHFALSDALVRTSVVPTLWWHSTLRPTLILGAGQAHTDTTAFERAGVLVVRRQAGGTAIYAAPGVLGLDVMLPPSHLLAPPDVLETYRWLGETWVDALRQLHIDAHLVTVAEARAAGPFPGDETIRMACFGSLSPYEVTARGRKLVGLAQVRRRTGVLLQSAVHTHFDADALAPLVGDTASGLPDRLRAVAIGLDEVSSPVPEDRDLTASLERSLLALYGISLENGAWTETELDHAGLRAEDLTTTSPEPAQ